MPAIMPRDPRYVKPDGTLTQAAHRYLESIETITRAASAVPPLVETFADFTPDQAAALSRVQTAFNALRSAIAGQGS